MKMKGYQHDLEKDYELLYWTRQLKFTTDELKAAVAAV